MNLSVRCCDLRKKNKTKQNKTKKLPALLITTQITFEGRSGSSYTGDIAIDDVSLMEGICAGKNLD